MTHATFSQSQTQTSHEDGRPTKDASNQTPPSINRCSAVSSLVCKAGKKYEFGQRGAMSRSAVTGFHIEIEARSPAVHVYTH